MITVKDLSKTLNRLPPETRIFIRYHSGSIPTTEIPAENIKALKLVYTEKRELIFGCIIEDNPTGFWRDVKSEILNDNEE